MIAEWKQLYEAYRDKLRPNRKTGADVDAYFRGKHPYEPFDSEEFRKVVESNIMKNECFRAKLPEGALPDIKCYRAGAC